MMKKWKKRQILWICLCTCFFLLGVICFVIPNVKKSGGEENKFDNWATNIEKDNAYHDLLEKYLTSTLEHFDKILDCEVDIDWLENDVVGVNVKVSVSAHNIENDILKTDIGENISRAVGVPAENVVVSLDVK